MRSKQEGTDVFPKGTWTCVTLTGAASYADADVDDFVFDHLDEI